MSKITEQCGNRLESEGTPQQSEDSPEPAAKWAVKISHIEELARKRRKVKKTVKNKKAKKKKKSRR
jgi:hypothetical protein